MPRFPYALPPPARSPTSFAIARPGPAFQQYHYEEVDPITGGSASFLVGGFLPVLDPTSPVAAGGSAVADAPDVVVITDDEDEDWDEDV